MSHVEAHRSYAAANTCDNGFPMDHVEERFPYLIKGSHVALVFFFTLDSVTRDYRGI